MPRPKPSVELAPLGFRLPVTIIERLDAYCGALSEKTGGHSISRSDAIRVLLDRALAVEGFPPAGQKAPKRK